MPHNRPESETPEKLMVERLKSLLQRMHHATGQALREIDEMEEPKAFRWRCRCGQERAFTKPQKKIACGTCEKCGGDSWTLI